MTGAAGEAAGCAVTGAAGEAAGGAVPRPSVGTAPPRPRLRDPRVRAGLAVLVLVLGLNAVAALLARSSREPGGEPWSAWATRPEGLAAYASLLAREGHRVRAAREAPSERAPDVRATLVLVEPEAVTGPDARALRTFLVRGGRLVVSDREPSPWLDELVSRPPRWSERTIERPALLAPVPEVAGVAVVRPDGPGAWASAGVALPVLGTGRASLLALATVGRGRLVLLADPSPLGNSRLARADHAALGLALAGPRGRPVAFAEWAHGAGRATGLAALPSRWRIALGGLGLAALVFLLSRARRLGPPEPEARELGPPRALYAHALGAALARTRRPGEAAEPVRAEARRRLARRAGHDEPEALRRAARRAGLEPEEARAVLDGVHDEAGALAAGRALARLGPSGGAGVRRGDEV